jgi:replicative DNA helicase
VVDWVLLVYRESYYNSGIDDGITELIIAKQRGGGAGTSKTVKVRKDWQSERLIGDRIEREDSTNFL